MAILVTKESPYLNALLDAGDRGQGRGAPSWWWGNRTVPKDAFKDRDRRSCTSRSRTATRRRRNSWLDEHEVDLIDARDLVKKGQKLEGKILVEAVQLYLKKRLDVHWGRVWAT